MANSLTPVLFGAARRLGARAHRCCWLRTMNAWDGMKCLGYTAGVLSPRPAVTGEGLVTYQEAQEALAVGVGPRGSVWSTACDRDAGNARKATQL